MLLDIKSSGKKVIIAGNGGSAAMASHVAVDFTKLTLLLALLTTMGMNTGLKRLWIALQTKVIC